LFFSFFLYYARLIRSFAIVYIYSFISANILALYLIRKKNNKLLYKEILKFTLLSICFYLGISFFANKFLLPKTGFYNKTKYINALFNALKQPRLSFVIVKNQIVMTLFSLFWFLPIFFYIQTSKLLKEKKWHLLIPRFWAVGIYVFSFALTFIHMFIGTQRNPEYLIFSRYLDPIIIVLFAYCLADLFTYLKSRNHKIKLHWSIYLILGYLFWYFVYRFYYGSYKFGNTMSIYYLRNFKDNPLANVFLLTLLGIWLYSIIKHKRYLIIYLFTALFIWLSFASITNTINVPKYVINRYYNRIQDWKLSMQQYDYPDVPLCVHIDGITPETYYLYHFLYPHQYLKNCNSYLDKRPRLIITRKKKNISLPNTCVQDFKFRSGESIYYCPLGY